MNTNDVADGRGGLPVADLSARSSMEQQTDCLARCHFHPVTGSALACEVMRCSNQDGNDCQAL